MLVNSLIIVERWIFFICLVVELEMEMIYDMFGVIWICDIMICKYEVNFKKNKKRKIIGFENWIVS